MTRWSIHLTGPQLAATTGSRGFDDLAAVAATPDASLVAVQLGGDAGVVVARAAEQPPALEPGFLLSGGDALRAELWASAMTVRDLARGDRYELTEPVCELDGAAVSPGTFQLVRAVPGGGLVRGVAGRGWEWSALDLHRADGVRAWRASRRRADRYVRIAAVAVAGDHVVVARTDAQRAVELTGHDLRDGGVAWSMEVGVLVELRAHEAILTASADGAEVAIVLARVGGRASDERAMILRARDGTSLRDVALEVSVGATPARAGRPGRQVHAGLAGELLWFQFYQSEVRGDLARAELAAYEVYDTRQAVRVGSDDDKAVRAMLATQDGGVLTVRYVSPGELALVRSAHAPF